MNVNNALIEKLNNLKQFANHAYQMNTRKTLKHVVNVLKDPLSILINQVAFVIIIRRYLKIIFAKNVAQEKL